MSEQIDWGNAPADATHCWAQAQDFFKLDHGNWMVWYGNEMRWAKSTIAERWGGLVERPTTPSWSGEGLPPAGAVCEVRNAPGGWGKAVITHQGKGLTVWLWHSENPDQVEYAEIPDRLEFRPIRTPEQIAADEREAAILDMERICRIGDFGSGGLAALYDAGYRKP